MPRAALLVAVVMLTLLSATALAADVRLPLGPYVRVGSYVPVEVTTTAGGRHELRSDHSAAVRWEGAGRVVLPVLVMESPGERWRVTVDGEAVELPVSELAAGERLVVNFTARPAGEVADAARQAFAGDEVRIIAATWDAAAIAYDIADAVVLQPPTPAQRRALLAAGVSILSPQHPADDLPPGDAATPGSAGPDAVAPQAPILAKVGDLWLERPPSRPVIRLIEPQAYAAVTGWRPGRPAVERWLLAGAGGAMFLAAAAILWLTRRTGIRLASLAIVAAIIVAAVVAWSALRPTVALREAHLPWHAGQPPATQTPDDAPLHQGHDRWLFVIRPGHPEPGVARIAFLGATYPVGYDRQHLRTLAPVIECDAHGRPVVLELTLPPAWTAAAVQRLADPPPDADPPPAWSRPVQRLHQR